MYFLQGMYNNYVTTIIIFSIITLCLRLPSNLIQASWSPLPDGLPPRLPHSLLPLCELGRAGPVHALCACTYLPYMGQGPVITLAGQKHTQISPNSSQTFGSYCISYLVIVSRSSFLEFQIQWQPQLVPHSLQLVLQVVALSSTFITSTKPVV